MAKWQGRSASTPFKSTVADQALMGLSRVSQCQFLITIITIALAKIFNLWAFPRSITYWTQKWKENQLLTSTIPVSESSWMLLLLLVLLLVGKLMLLLLALLFGGNSSMLLKLLSELDRDIWTSWFVLLNQQR